MADVRFLLPVQRRQAAIGAALHRLGSDQGLGSPSGDASSGGGKALRPRAKRPRSDVTLEKVSGCSARCMSQRSGACAAALSASAQQSLACSASIPVFCIRCAIGDCCYSRCGTPHSQRCSGHARWTIVQVWGWLEGGTLGQMPPAAVASPPEPPAEMCSRQGSLADPLPVAAAAAADATPPAAPASGERCRALHMLWSSASASICAKKACWCVNLATPA